MRKSGEGRTEHDLAWYAAVKAHEKLGNSLPGQTLLSDESLSKPVLELVEELVFAEQLSGVDRLTGLANDKGLEKALIRLVNELSRQPESERDDLLIMKFDVRYFKVFYELFGWNEVDLYLKAVADVLKKTAIPVCLELMILSRGWVVMIL